MRTGPYIVLLILFFLYGALCGGCGGAVQPDAGGAPGRAAIDGACATEGAVTCARHAPIQIGYVCQAGAWVEAVYCGDLVGSACSTACAAPLALCCIPVSHPRFPATTHTTEKLQ